VTSRPSLELRLQTSHRIAAKVLAMKYAREATGGVIFSTDITGEE
jgi:hypothetical protein